MAHADWSVTAPKRWMCVATPHRFGWSVTIEKVGALDTLLARLRARAGAAPVALGVDAPIGLPASYRPAQQQGFPAFLGALTEDAPFFDVCDDAAEISPDRPFYPRRSRAGVRRHDLLERLGITNGEQLLRQCERKQGVQPAASPMFWTLGANQVGKGAICLWRDLLVPALRAPDPPSLWPFDGALADLLRPGRIAIAETYPANAMRQLNLGFKGSKRRQSDRRTVANALRAHLDALDATPDITLAAKLEDGFGTAAAGEDQFDSLIGLIRMLQIVRDPALDQLPEPAIRRWEGWILGRPVSIS
ncbi:MAG: hypothetical protein M3N26_06445 [Pseudomonadota bacterium]|nr:hypothetical protein [Pseudomonadota bacterium]